MKIASRNFYTQGTFRVPAGVRMVFAQAIPHSQNSAWDTAFRFGTATVMYRLSNRRYFSLVSWGFNSSGQLGLNDTTTRSSPVVVAGLTSTNTGQRDVYKVFCSTNNLGLISHRADSFLSNGAAGTFNMNLTGASPTSPVVMFDGVPLTGTNCFRSLDNGIFMNTIGQLTAWGNNTYGTLGNNSITNQTTPVAVVGTRSYSEVFLVENAVFARTTDNAIFCWGRNDTGGLGLNDVTNRSSPTLFAAAGNHIWKKFQSVDQGTIGLQEDGTVWVWGKNSNINALAIGGPSNMSNPIQMPSLPAIKDIWASNAAGTGNVVALARDGTLYGWGQNSSGSLGLNNTLAQSVPQIITSDPTIVSARAGESNTHYLKADGTMWGAGLNAFGSVGDGTLTNRSVHAQVVPNFDDGFGTVRPSYFVNEINPVAPPIPIPTTPGENLSFTPYTSNITAVSGTYRFNAGGLGVGIRIFWFE
jgi:alpha-tubulin suppressor-like RCC1 family protein